MSSPLNNLVAPALRLQLAFNFLLTQPASARLPYVGDQVIVRFFSVHDLADDCHDYDSGDPAGRQPNDEPQSGCADDGSPNELPSLIDTARGDRRNQKDYRCTCKWRDATVRNTFVNVGHDFSSNTNIRLLGQPG